MKRRMRSKIIAYVCTRAVGFLLLFSLSFFCVAAGQTCSVTLHCVVHEPTQDLALSEDTYALVQIARAKIDPASGTLSYEIETPFEPYDCDWNGMAASALQTKAYSLKQYVIQENLPVRTAVSDTAGEVRFSDLTPGLYLIYRAQAKGENAKYADMPVLIGVPQMINGEKNDHVDVYPKYSADVPIATTKPEVPATSPTAPQKPNTPEDTPYRPKLPNTGQLIWPIPLLLLGGFGTCTAGIVIRKRTEKEKDET